MQLGISTPKAIRSKAPMKRASHAQIISFPSFGRANHREARDVRINNAETSIDLTDLVFRIFHINGQACHISMERSFLFLQILSWGASAYRFWPLMLVKSVHQYWFILCLASFTHLSILAFKSDCQARAIAVKAADRQAPKNLGQKSAGTSPVLFSKWKGKC